MYFDRFTLGDQPVDRCGLLLFQFQFFGDFGEQGFFPGIQKLVVDHQLDAIRIQRQFINGLDQTEQVPDINLLVGNRGLIMAVTELSTTEA